MPSFDVISTDFYSSVGQNNGPGLYLFFVDGWYRWPSQAHGIFHTYTNPFEHSYSILCTSASQGILSILSACKGVSLSSFSTLRRQGKTSPSFCENWKSYGRVHDSARTRCTLREETCSNRGQATRVRGQRCQVSYNIKCCEIWERQ